MATLEAPGADAGDADGWRALVRPSNLGPMPVPLVANAFGASLTGVAVDLAGADLTRAAGHLFSGSAVLSALGVGASACVLVAARPAGSS